MRQVDPPVVEIFLVSYNTVGLLLNCISSINQHGPDSETAEVRVAVFDNASTDGSAERVLEQFPEVRLVTSSTNIGFARANNALARGSEADYFLLLNSDTHLTQDIVSPLLHALQSEASVALAGPRLIWPNGEPQFSSEEFPSLKLELARELRGTKVDVALARLASRSLERARHVDLIRRRVPHATNFLWATCWLMRRSDFLRHGLFDEFFSTYDEDLDYCRRLRARGQKILYVSECELVHYGGASSSSSEKLALQRQARKRYYLRWSGRVEAQVYGAINGTMRRMKGLNARRRLAS